MIKPIQNLLTLFGALFVVSVSYARADRPATEEKTATFVFLPGNDIFLLKGNETELERLYALVDAYRTEITTGLMPVYVDGYCASLPTPKENLRTAFVRANRVKSELILHKGLKEMDFITNNYARAFHNNKDVVVVTLRVPAKEEPRQPEPVREELQQQEPQVMAQPQPEPEPQPTQEPVVEVAPKPAVFTKPYCLAVRTNVLYDALLLPTLGVEWRVNRDLGIRFDGSLAWWGNNHDKVQKMWILNPEVRWYLLRDKRFYVGASGNYGQYNIYKYAVGSIVSKDTGHQGSMWGAGLTVGYQLYLSRHFSVDFNLGLGYTRFDYDSFGITDGVRVYQERDRTKNFWGPTQAGISLVWTIGGNK